MNAKDARMISFSVQRKSNPFQLQYDNVMEEIKKSAMLGRYSLTINFILDDKVSNRLAKYGYAITEDDINNCRCTIIEW